MIIKKVFSFIIVSCLLALNLVLPISAEENSNTKFISDIQMIEINETDLVNAFTFYSEIDAKSYLVKTYKDRVDVYDSETNILYNSMEIESTPIQYNSTASNAYNNLLSVSPDDYEKWGNWGYSRRDSMHIGDISGWTISTLAGALTGAFGAFLGPLTGLATIIYNNRYEGVYANIYISTNVYCTILVKERYDFYDNNSNAFIKSELKSPSWWGSPWDYTQPAACRVLAERY